MAADFIVTFERFALRETQRFFGFSKEKAIRFVKKRADETGYLAFQMSYMHSGKTVGRWEKRGSRWYKV